MKRLGQGFVVGITSYNLREVLRTLGCNELPTYVSRCELFKCCLLCCIRKVNSQHLDSCQSLKINMAGILDKNNYQVASTELHKGRGEMCLVVTRLQDSQQQL